ncbi:MAG: wax ester/triacylglycerol synthase family O-acyltransferase [Halioglobus sp.]|nr:wax ester/triacylglycerol synthase family O-acyltransferase [Halioglobus sp.]
MKKLSFVDTAFLLAEKPETPMHVGGVSLYTLPEGADEQEFLHGLADNLRDMDRPLPPFGDRLKTGALGLAGPAYWEPDPGLDLDYHVRHSALPRPGRYRELFTLVSRLHGTLLDRHRPLWEMHLIEGLQNRQFALYTKTHHAAVDGARSVHLARSMLSADPQSQLPESPLSLQSWERYRDSLRLGKRPDFTDEEVRNVADMLKASFDSGANVFQALRGFTRAWTGRGGDLSLPHLHVPRSSINTEVDTARRFVAQSWPFARLHAVAKAFDGTFNDAVLAMCAGALRRYLQVHAELPEASLKAMVPVSIRQEGDIDSSNAVAAISVDLATNIADPVERVRAIQTSVHAGKDFFRGLSASEIQLFTLLTSMPTLMLVPLGLASRLPPYNTVISNVPGIQETMYWNGARMDGSYPASIITDGIAINITLLTYDTHVDFGIIACRRSVPQVQRLIDYMEDSLAELEDAAGLRRAARRKRAATARGAKKKTASKSRPKSGAKAKSASAGRKKPAAGTKSKRAARKKAPAKKRAANK